MDIRGGFNSTGHVLAIYSWVQSELGIELKHCEELQLVVEGDDSSLISPYTESEEMAVSLQWFFNMIGFSGEIILGVVDASQLIPGERYCTTNSAAQHIAIARGNGMLSLSSQRVQFGALRHHRHQVTWLGFA